ncbi:hypothetical protein D1832_01555 [Dermacoccus abyssi]|uniref:Uncharacterized protein n=1 Tax=Dermacoccus abyssi TaxID=322596 RepID=A0A417ZBW5_9MICO|nr:hypothetical protein D1832_01555 [Dermacoccus abyssi]
MSPAVRRTTRRRRRTPRRRPARPPPARVPRPRVPAATRVPTPATSWPRRPRVSSRCSRRPVATARSRSTERKPRPPSSA